MTKRKAFVLNFNQEDEDWIKHAPGYKDEVAIRKELAQKYAQKKGTTDAAKGRKTQED